MQCTGPISRTLGVIHCSLKGHSKKWEPPLCLSWDNGAFCTLPLWQAIRETPERERETDRQTDTQRERQTDRETDKQTEADRQRQTDRDRQRDKGRQRIGLTGGKWAIFMETMLKALHSCFLVYKYFSLRRSHSKEAIPPKSRSTDHRLQHVSMSNWISWTAVELPCSHIDFFLFPPPSPQLASCLDFSLEIHLDLLDFIWQSNLESVKRNDCSSRALHKHLQPVHLKLI